MGSQGTNSPRSAGKVAWHPQTLVLLVMFVSLIVVVASIQFAQWVQYRVTGYSPVRPNPIETVIELVQGERSWEQSSTVALALVGATVFLLAVLVVVLRRRVDKSTARVDSAAKHLASNDDIQSFNRKKAVEKAQIWLPTPQQAATYPGLMFGRTIRRKKDLYSTWEDLYLIIFGPRMGKTTSQVIPAIVDAPGHTIVTSNKRDVVDDTIKVTRYRGEVWVFDPQQIASNTIQQPWFFDPLDFIRRDPKTMDAAALRLADIFKTATRGEDSGGDAFFSEGGKELLARLFLAAALDQRPIGDVYLWANDDRDRTPVGILNQYPEWEQQARALGATYLITERTRSGLFSQAAQMASTLGRREVLKWVTPSPDARRFDPDQFVRSSGRDTMYLLSKEGADNTAALTTALTASILTAAERYGEECGGRLPIPLVAALDEAANVVRWPELPMLYSHYGSRGIILMTILQSYAQGVEVWGENGMELLWSAASILLYGGGVRDEKMLQKLETLVGEVEVFESSSSRTKDGQYTVSHNRRERKIFTVSELAALERGRALVFASKRRPFLVELVPWWDRTWHRDIEAQLKEKV